MEKKWPYGITSFYRAEIQRLISILERRKLFKKVKEKLKFQMTKDTISKDLKFKRVWVGISIEYKHEKEKTSDFTSMRKLIGYNNEKD